MGFFNLMKNKIFNYDRNGYSKEGFNKSDFQCNKTKSNNGGNDRTDYNKKCFNIKGLNKDDKGYNIDGLDSMEYDEKDFNKDTYDIIGYNELGIHKNGTKYDKDGYNQLGFNRLGIHRNGTHYDEDGYNKKGYNREGYDREGFDKYGYDRKGYDKYGYDNEYYDREGYNRDGYNREGYNKEGYNKEGYNREGYNRGGFDKYGYDKYGYDAYGLDRKDYYMARSNKKNKKQKGVHVGSNKNYSAYDKENYDHQRYNEEGNFKLFIQNYEKINNVEVANEEKSVRNEIKDILWELDEVESLLNYEKIDAAVRALRTGAELFTKEMLRSKNITGIFRDQNVRLQYIRDQKLIESEVYTVLNKIRLLGNESVHVEKSARNIQREEVILLHKSFKKFVHEWISSI